MAALLVQLLVPLNFSLLTHMLLFGLLDLSHFFVFEGLNSGISDLGLVLLVFVQGFESRNVEDFLLILSDELIGTADWTSRWVFGAIWAVNETVDVVASLLIPCIQNSFCVLGISSGFVGRIDDGTIFLSLFDEFWAFLELCNILSFDIADQDNDGKR